MVSSSVALVLSGGGARGLAHIGVVKALREAGVVPDLIVGTSMGGVVGAALAAGIPVAHMVEAAHEFARRRNFVGFADPPGYHALLRGRKLIRWLIAQLGAETFADLHYPLVLVAADLYSGREVCLDSGSLAPALQATIAIPGLIDPVPDGSRLLVDGGVVNVLPTDVARRRGAERVIAVYTPPAESMDAWQAFIRTPLFPKGLRRMVIAVARAADLLIARQAEHQLRVSPADVLIVPNLPSQVTMLTGFEQVDALVEAGERAARAALSHVLG